MAFPPLPYPHGIAAGDIGHQANIDLSATPGSTGGRFVGYGEDAVDSIFNRAPWALSENLELVRQQLETVLVWVEGFQAIPKFGHQGNQGRQGTQGVIGAQGPQGVTGIQGAVGFQGKLAPTYPFHIAELRSNKTSTATYTDLISTTFTTGADTAAIAIVFSMNNRSELYDPGLFILLNVNGVTKVTLTTDVMGVGLTDLTIPYKMAVSASTSVTVTVQWKSPLGDCLLQPGTGGDRAVIYVRELYA